MAKFRLRNDAVALWIASQKGEYFVDSPANTACTYPSQIHPDSTLPVAIHTLVKDSLIGGREVPAGTHLCPFHSPWRPIN